MKDKAEIQLPVVFDFIAGSAEALAWCIVPDHLPFWAVYLAVGGIAAALRLYLADRKGEQAPRGLVRPTVFLWPLSLLRGIGRLFRS